MKKKYTRLEKLEHCARIEKAVKDLRTVSRCDSVAYATIMGSLIASATKEDIDLICKLVDEEVLAKQ
jgi:hypothetical protein